MIYFFFVVCVNEKCPYTSCIYSASNSFFQILIEFTYNTWLIVFRLICVNIYVLSEKIWKKHIWGTIMIPLLQDFLWHLKSSTNVDFSSFSFIFLLSCANLGPQVVWCSNIYESVLIFFGRYPFWSWYCTDYELLDKLLIERSLGGAENFCGKLFFSVKLTYFFPQSFSKNGI